MCFKDISNQRLGKFYRQVIVCVQIIGLTSTYIIPATYAVQRWIDTCYPSTFLYFLLPECSQRESQPAPDFHFHAFLLGISLLSFWLLIDFLGEFLFQVFEMTFLPTSVFQYYLHNLKTTIKSTPVSMFRLQRLFKVYQMLQVLCQYFNVLHQDSTIIIFLAANIYTFIICLYSLITVGSGISLAHLFLFSCGFLNAFLGIVVCFGLFGQVQKASGHVLMLLLTRALPSTKNYSTQQDRRCMKINLKSLRPLHVRIGNVNFVDALTPVVLLDFCTVQLVNLLLLS